MRSGYEIFLYPVFPDELATVSLLLASYTFSFTYIAMSYHTVNGKCSTCMHGRKFRLLASSCIMWQPRNPYAMQLPYIIMHCEHAQSRKPDPLVAGCLLIGDYKLPRS